MLLWSSQQHILRSLYQISVLAQFSSKDSIQHFQSIFIDIVAKMMVRITNRRTKLFLDTHFCTARYDMYNSIADPNTRSVLS